MRPMQGIFAHIFAAAMAFTVFYFPTPRDLKEWFLPSQAGQAVAAVYQNLNKLGLDESKIAFLGEYTDIAEACAVTGQPSAWARDCSSPSVSSPPTTTTLPPQPIRIAFGPEVEERLAGQLVCQALWADAVASRKQFDAVACLPA